MMKGIAKHYIFAPGKTYRNNQLMMSLPGPQWVQEFFITQGGIG